MEPGKRIFFVALQNVAILEALFQGKGIKVVTRSHYLGGFIGV